MLNPGSQVPQVPPRDRLWRSPDADVATGRSAPPQAGHGHRQAAQAHDRPDQDPEPDPGIELPRMRPAPCSVQTTPAMVISHVTRHGWWKPIPDAAAPRKITGLVTPGHDCNCSPEITAACQWCGEPLASARADARFCSGGQCRQAAYRDSSRNDLATAAVTSHASSRNQLRLEDVTITARKRNTPQVSGQLPQEAATREVERLMPEEDQENQARPSHQGPPADPRCSLCGAVAVGTDAGARRAV
jgi:hypothetical protein